MSHPANESSVDVLVVGAGPAGLMCAYGLAKAGVNVRIVEKRADKIAAGQADGIQPRTIEVLQSYGLAERLLREACQLHRVAFYHPGPNGGVERVARIPDVTAPTARYPFEATLHQGAIEDIFIDAMQPLGLVVERQTVPVSMQLSKDAAELNDPSAYPVHVVLQHLDSNATQGDAETETIHAKFVVGADGAHSWVRKSLGIAMEGAQTEYIWGVLDLVPETDFPDVRSRCAIHSANGSCMIIPREGDGIRLYVQLSDTDVVDPATGRVDPTKMGPSEILEVARRSLHPYTIATPKEFEWSTIYIIGQRVASQFSANERVFIAGDACHTHSPKAGQGMNASMSDSHNLVWKLAQVLRGTADMSLLKTYELERRKFAQDLISFDREFSALFSRKPRSHENDTEGVSHEEFFGAFKTFGAFTSGIGIHYADSAIVDSTHQAAAQHITVGQRMPPQMLLRAADARPYELQDLLPADARFKILVFAGDTTQPAQRARVERLAGELHGVLALFGAGGAVEGTFDVLAISSGKKEDVGYADVPALLRSHWSKVFVDDVDMLGRQGGHAYENFGIGSEGAVVVVRPDGYVGLVFPFGAVQDAKAYFAAFLRARPVQ
ncbi:hypothetical protein FIBSPDRAFT_746817 [Athelia psychrophila]|uniref:FAD binding domain-containing protein n=1 Tax=Athelia psychrophila TaxID=1759441 RepID=A0A166G885_9AGAM|nr:hypothetical protein FIBSPDRAFT_746817 [Fibularhizoctonia sp. CBS 109695]